MGEQTIVAVDDQPEVLGLLGEVFRARGRAYQPFSDGEAAIKFVAGNAADIVLVVLDLELGPGKRGGIELLGDLRAAHPDLPIIILTGNATVDAAVRAVKAGATDFLVKDMYLEDTLDVSVEKIERMLAHVRERRRLEGENSALRAANRALREEAERRLQFVAEATAMQEIKAKIERVAALPRPVLVLGERGTGKELVAAAIHRLSPRANGPFITINCAAVTETLLESELFGHEQGAFTGATKRKEGKFELADGGTLFLDEVGNMTPEFQTKILRVLEYQRFERVAGSKTIQVDVRVVAATNEDMEQAMEAGRFRRDLYDRLAFETIRLPSLRSRKEDIPALAAHFLAMFRSEVPGVAARVISAEALARLQRYDFPGNVRELKNVVERAAYGCDRSTLDERDVERALPPVAPRVTPAGGTRSAQAADEGDSGRFNDDPGLPLPERVAAFERALVKDALQRAKNKQREAAELLGMTYDQFRHLYRKYGMKDGGAS